MTPSTFRRDTLIVDRYLEAKGVGIELLPAIGAISPRGCSRLEALAGAGYCRELGDDRRDLRQPDRSGAGRRILIWPQDARVGAPPKSLGASCLRRQPDSFAADRCGARPRLPDRVELYPTTGKI